MAEADQAMFPAYCDTCGAIWLTGGLLALGGVGTQVAVQLTNVTVPCPNDGTHTGRIVDGAYNSVRDLAGVRNTLSPEVAEAGDIEIGRAHV